MANETQDGQEKTEQPSDRRRDEYRAEGQIARSVEVTAFFGILAAFAPKDGAALWRVDLATLPGTEKPLYGHASSPLLVGDCVVLHVGVKEKQSIVRR